MQTTKKYPVLRIDADAVRQNAAVITSLCREHGAEVAGVIKFSDGDLDIARAYLGGGCRQIASSRILHLKRIREEIPGAPTMLIRIPMMSEAEDVVRYSDISMNSEECVLRRLDEAAGTFGVTHSVVLMLDVGDRREGVCDKDRLIEMALAVEHQMDHLYLAGVGSSFACMSGVLPDWENLSQLADCARQIEAAIGRRLDIVSGGSSITLTLLTGKNPSASADTLPADTLPADTLPAGSLLPLGINHLRIGGAIANPIGIRKNRGVVIDGLREDCFILTAEIIEVQRKPSPPAGSGKNWAGQAVEFIDRGIRTRAIIALGSQDIGDALQLIPEDPGITIEGGSSDHTVLDVTDSEREWKPGDTISFRMFYMPLLYSFATRHVRKELL